VSQVYTAEQGIGFAHTLQHRHRDNPEANAETYPPPGTEAEGEAHRGEDSDQHQFAVAAQESGWGDSPTDE